MDKENKITQDDNTRLSIDIISNISAIVMDELSVVSEEGYEWVNSHGSLTYDSNKKKLWILDNFVKELTHTQVLAIYGLGYIYRIKILEGHTNG